LGICPRPLFSVWVETLNLSSRSPLRSGRPRTNVHWTLWTLSPAGADGEPDVQGRFRFTAVRPEPRSPGPCGPASPRSVLTNVPRTFSGLRFAPVGPGPISPGYRGSSFHYGPCRANVPWTFCGLRSASVGPGPISPGYRGSSFHYGPCRANVPWTFCTPVTHGWR